MRGVRVLCLWSGKSSAESLTMTSKLTITRTGLNTSKESLVCVLESTQRILFHFHSAQHHFNQKTPHISGELTCSTGLKSEISSSSTRNPPTLTSFSETLSYT